MNKAELWAYFGADCMSYFLILAFVKELSSTMDPVG